MNDEIRMKCYIGNGSGIKPKRFTCYRGDRVGYTDECMKAYDEYRQVALDVLKSYEDTNLTPEEISTLKARLDAAQETISKVENCLQVIFGAKEYVKPGTGIYMTTKVALEYIKSRRRLEDSYE